MKTLVTPISDIPDFANHRFTSFLSIKLCRFVFLIGIQILVYFWSILVTLFKMPHVETSKMPPVYKKAIDNLERIIMGSRVGYHQNYTPEVVSALKKFADKFTMPPTYWRLLRRYIEET